MKQENSQPVKQHKKMNGFADRKLLAGLVFAVGDYMALTLSACLALHLRNIVMTYNVYHINLSYIFFWVPLVFMPFILYSGLYTKRMLTYKMTEKLFYASLYGTVFSIIILHEVITPRMVVGCIIILIAVIISNLSESGGEGNGENLQKAGETA